MQHDIITIDNDLRVINVPESLRNIGVENDEGVMYLPFTMPRYYRGFDLSTFVLRINYTNAAGQGDAYKVTDLVVDGDNMTFSWEIGGNATAYRGKVRFIVCFKLTDADGRKLKEYNTTTAAVHCLEGMETEEAVKEYAPEVYEQMLLYFDEVNAQVRANAETAARATTEITESAAAAKQAQAAAEAAAETAQGLVSEHPVKLVQSLDTANPMYLRDFESGTYILYGKFRPFNGSTSTFTFSSGMLVSVLRTTATTYVQVFYSKANTIQYLEITDDSYTRNDAKLANMESKANLVTEITEEADDDHYPSTRAVWELYKSQASAAGPITYVESLDPENIVNLRDLESGNYVIYGYFSPYENSNMTMSCDSNLISVYRVAAGTHIFCFEPLNAKVVFIEILVDENAPKGYTYSRTIIPMLDLFGLIGKVGDLAALNTTDKSSIVAAINEVLQRLQ